MWRDCGQSKAALLVLSMTLHVFQAQSRILSGAFKFPTSSKKKKWEESIMIMHTHFSFFELLFLNFILNYS